MRLADGGGTSTFSWLLFFRVSLSGSLFPEVAHEYQSLILEQCSSYIFTIPWSLVIALCYPLKPCPRDMYPTSSTGLPRSAASWSFIPLSESKFLWWLSLWMKKLVLCWGFITFTEYWKHVFLAVMLIYARVLFSDEHCRTIIIITTWISSHELSHDCNSHI